VLVIQLRTWLDLEGSNCSIVILDISWQ
jgi:hypothetical protein